MLGVCSAAKIAFEDRFLVEGDSAHSLRVTWPDYPDTVDLNTIFVDADAEFLDDSSI